MEVLEMLTLLTLLTLFTLLTWFTMLTWFRMLVLFTLFKLLYTAKAQCKIEFQHHSQKPLNFKMVLG